MTTKYKAGDVVHVRLSEHDAYELSHGHLSVYPEDIIAHHPAPDPVVRWANFYPTDGHTTREEADLNRSRSMNRTCVLRLEWPDGDTSKPLLSDNVTVEGV